MSSVNQEAADNNWPLTGITLPGEHDVVFGRGGASIHHDGNIKYRNMVRAHQRQYIGYDDSRHMKTLLTHELVKKFRQLTPPGRFLKKNEATGLWNDVGTAMARRKTAQLFREGAKQLRKEMRADGEILSSEDEESDSTCSPPASKKAKTSAAPPAALVSPESIREPPLGFVEFAATHGFTNTRTVAAPVSPSVMPPPMLSADPIPVMREFGCRMPWETEMDMLSNDLRSCVRDGHQKLFLYGEPKSSLEMLEAILDPILDDVPSSSVAA